VNRGGSTAIGSRLRNVAIAIGSRIARAVRDGSALHWKGALADALGPGLAEASGFALLFEGLRQTGDESEDWASLTTRFLRSGASGTHAHAGLYAGLGGALFTSKYVARTRGGLSRFIAALDGAVASSPATWDADELVDADVDVVSGAAGISLASAAAPASAGAPALRAALERLLANDAARLLVYSYVEEPPVRCLNLGVAHGFPGVLAAYLRNAPDPAVVRDAVALLRAAALPNGTSWPYFAGAPPRTRSAWCYGQPGVPAVLAAAAEALDDPALLAFALDAASSSAAQLGEKGIVDDGLCHGTAGNAVCLWAVARRAHSDEASERALELMDSVARRFDESIAFGYRQWHPDNGYGDDATFLTGSAGIALGMLTVVEAVEPSWLDALAV
jgi:lantibiotic biosynthesis protein